MTDDEMVEIVRKMDAGDPDAAAEIENWSNEEYERICDVAGVEAYEVVRID